MNGPAFVGTLLAAGACAHADTVGLAVLDLYHGVNRPIAIDVVAPESETLALTLMAEDGTVIAGPVPVTPGTIQLQDHMPGVVAVRRTAYLQLFDGHAPIGSSLVVQPMLSRLVPRTREAINPNGIRYTEIVGWDDELSPPPVEPPGDASTADEPPAEAAEDPAAPPTPVVERLFTGFRIYPERDVIMLTSHGVVRIAMRPDAAPNTAWNFVELCDGGFYTGVIFHRIVPLTRNGDPFVIQAGDPTGSGNGGPGYWLPIEPSDLPHDFGVISMARDVAPDSAGSQFFICLSRAGTARLDGHYCAFGYVVEGAAVIRALADVELDLEAGGLATGRPLVPPVIERTELVPAPPRLPGRGRPDRPVFVEELPPPPDERPPRVPR